MSLGLLSGAHHEAPTRFVVRIPWLEGICRMKIYEAEIPLSSVQGSFALPPLPLEITEKYRVMRLHVKADGCPMWWRRDGEQIDPRMSYRIGSGGSHMVDDPALIPLLRFAFDPESAVRAIEGEPTLRLVYEGLDQTAWIKDPRELSPAEFLGPIKAAQGATAQLHTKNVVDVITNTNPGVVMPPAPVQAAEMEAAERAAVEATQRQMLGKHAAAVAAVRQSMNGGRS